MSLACRQEDRITHDRVSLAGKQTKSERLSEGQTPETPSRSPGRTEQSEVTRNAPDRVFSYFTHITPLSDTFTHSKICSKPLWATDKCAHVSSSPARFVNLIFKL